MYKIYFNENPIFLINKKNINSYKPSERDIILKGKEITSFINIFLKLKSEDKITKIFILTSSPRKIFLKLLSETKLIEAGGGMALNTDNQLLMIKRNNKWDLPKGKIEKGETIRQTALREVKEECGISGLKIIKKLTPTYHIYFEKNSWILKKSVWYQMFSADKQKPVPQEEENITEVHWFNKDEVLQCLPHAFSNIKDIISSNYL